MDTEEFVAELEEWNNILHHRQLYLDRGYRVYRSVYFFQVLSISIFGFLAGSLSGYSAVESSAGNNDLSIAFSILSLACSVLGLFWTAVGVAFSPQSTASQCSTCSKAYFNLYNEIQVKVIEVRKTNIMDVTYPTQLLLYASRIYNINITEPGLILIGRTSNKDVRPHGGLTPDQLRHISAMLDTLPQNEDTVRVKEIVERRLHSLS